MPTMSSTKRLFSHSSTLALDEFVCVCQPLFFASSVVFPDLISRAVPLVFLFAAVCTCRSSLVSPLVSRAGKDELQFELVAIWGL